MIFLLSGAALLAGSSDSSESVDENQAVVGAAAALSRSDWTAVEGAIRRLSVVSVPAPRMEHAELLAAMRLYGEDRPEKAAQAAAALIASGRDTSAAAQFTLFLNSRRRARYLTLATGPLICAYAAVLLCSLYLGLRQNLHRLRTS